MSTLLHKFLSTVPNRDFELRHWLSPPFPPRFPLRRKHLASPAAYSHNTNVYTSLRELIVSSPPTPFTSPNAADFDIRIRNPLLKQAAYAYLQMKPTSPIKSQRHHRRFLVAFKDAFLPLRRCFGYIGRLLCCSQVYNAW